MGHLLFRRPSSAGYSGRRHAQVIPEAVERDTSDRRSVGRNGADSRFTNGLEGQATRRGIRATI